MARDSAVFKGLNAYVKNVRSEFEEKLGQAVEIPSISMDPERRPDIEKCADLAIQYLEDLGAQAEKVETPGNPVVFGQLVTDPRNPTVAIYNHLDVQPANEPEWRQDPFTFFNKNGRYEGRGSTDDKGPALTAMMAVRYAVDHGLPLNFKFFWELEEEIGSPNFERFMKKKRKQVQCDSVLVSDTIWIARNKPTMPYGLRGLLGFTIWLKTGKNDAHSGVTGGPARNPIGELAQLISQCYDARTGRVKIPGFYKDVKRATAREIASYLASGFSVEQFKKAHGFKSLRSDDPATVLKRFMAEPTFEVHGLVGGYTGPGVKTVIPPRAEAKLSTRLVPNQDPDEIFKLVSDFVKSKIPDVTIEHEATLRPYLGQFSGSYAQAGASAMKFGFGKETAFTREGGSIGSIVTMEQRLGVPITFLGLSLPEHGYHAPNENYDWRQASGGIKMFVSYFSEIAQFKE